MFALFAFSSEIFKIKFYNYSPVFPEQTIMKGVRSLSPAHARSAMWVLLKLFIYNLLWLAEYQCKGVAKFNLSDVFLWDQFRRS